MKSNVWQAFSAVSLSVLLMVPAFVYGESGSTHSADAEGAYDSPAGETGTMESALQADNPELEEFRTQAERDLIERVRQRLSRDASLAAAARDTQISAELGGTIILQGQVESEQEKERIATAVRAVRGVETVNNDLQVVPSTNLARSGVETIEPVSTATIIVVSDSSSVPSASDVQAAMVDKAATVADQELNQRIRQALNANASLSATGQNLSLETDHGEVILHGWVNSAAERADMITAVRQVPGVKDVEDRLQVASSKGVTGDERPSLSGTGSPKASGPSGPGTSAAGETMHPSDIRGTGHPSPLMGTGPTTGSTWQSGAGTR